ncbi:DUF2007 domain-containing protein [Candidatus Bathyarchaeota archaeon]|jgi:hypothetical protein|nr:DUF2007 domain-containing protein [Candidatus Bathyarchaeota archaeon]
MMKLYSPQNEADLAIIRSLLDGEEIYYFIYNDHFGTMRTGPKIDLFNAKAIMVSEESFERAKEIITDYRNNIRPEEVHPEYSLWDKIRMVVEMFVFGWFMPGRKWLRKSG